MKSSKLFWLALVSLLMLGLAGAMFACDDDDDDNDTTGDDDTSDGWTCEDVYTAMYVDCDLVFYNEDGDEIPLEEAISTCEAGELGYGLNGAIAACITDNAEDCGPMEDCLADLF